MGKLAMKPSHYNQLKRKVFAKLSKQNMSPREVSRRALTSTRVLWDIYWSSGGAFGNEAKYRYLKDDHITSAMISIMREYGWRK